MKTRNHEKMINLPNGLWCLLLILSLLVPGCGGGPKTKTMPTDLVWPPAPDTPRVKLIGSVSSTLDVGGPKGRSIKDILLGTDPGKEVKRLRQPYGVFVDSQEKIYVTDSGQGMVFVFDQKNARVDFIGHVGQGKLGWPIGIVVDEKLGRVFVSDASQKNVLVYDRDGNFRSPLARKGSFANPAGLALDPDKGLLYIIDSKAHDVKVYKTSGEFVKKFGERGSGEGQFNFPTNVALGKDGYIYIVDTGNHRVQVFDSEYEYYDDFGTLGRHPGQFRRPKGIALDSENHIYVVDSDFNNFQIFNQDYQILMPVGRLGKDYGQFWLPAGIFIDGMDRIYVVESINKRVQIFQYLKQAGKK